MTRGRLRLRALAAAIALLAAAGARAETIRIVIDKMDYAPATVAAKVGDAVEWINKDFLAHTATAKGEWDVTVAPDKTGRTVLTKAGTFDYTCRFHPNMKGRIVVSPGG